MYQIYVLVDPRDFLVRYVGMSQNPHRRYGMHIMNRSKASRKKDQWIKEVLDENKGPLLHILETVENKNEALKREEWWIQYYVSKGIKLVNGTHEFTKREDIAFNAASLESVKSLIISQKWTPQERKRRNTMYLYAARHKQGHRNGVEWRYISPLSKIEKLTEEEIIQKLG